MEITLSFPVTIRVFNRFIKGLQNDNIYIQMKDEVTFNTVDGTGSYQLAAGTLRVISMRTRVNNNDTEINLYNRESYDGIVTKNAEGQPLNAFVDYATSPPTVYFNPVPNSVYAIYYTRETLLDDMDEGSDNIALPQSALDMMVDELSYRYGGLIALPESEMNRLRAMADRSWRAFKSGNQERATAKRLVNPDYVV